MKTAREKAKDLINGMRNIVEFDEIFFNRLVDRAEKVIKEQDRDTRHACADNIANMEEEDTNGWNNGTIKKDRAFSAVINTKAV